MQRPGLLAPGPAQLDGVIDLAFRENARWVLVDYKTDRIDGDAGAYVSAYAPQVQQYRRAWERVTGESVAETLLFFTQLGQTFSAGSGEPAAAREGRNEGHL